MKEFIFLISGIMILLMTSCSSTANIYSLCEKDNKGNYIIKWEITPDPLKGNVEIYSSSSDDAFKNKKTPFLVANAEDRVATFKSPTSLSREYFLIRNNNSYSGIITNRYIPFDIIQNFRDLGGYFNDDNRQLRWGKIYRSGSLYNLSARDISKLQSLNIKTVIDLRNSEESQLFPDKFKGFSHYQISLDTLSSIELQDKITDRDFHRDEATTYMENAYLSILERNTEEIKNIFKILLDENNYPVLIHDNLGKDRAGIIAFLILRALDVNPDDAYSDYILSDDYIDLSSYGRLMRDMPESMQEAMTIILRANPDFLDYSFGIITKKYGSLDTYFEKVLGLNTSKRQKLKTILTY